MSESDIITILCTAPCLAFWGGVAAGMMYSSFIANDRDSSRRYPRPGTQPQRPEGFKPFRKHPDMLIEDETKKP